MSPHDHLPPARRRVRPAPPAVSTASSLAAASPSAVPTTAEPPPTYEIGYGKPPVHTRFQKGQSGNPKGRNKGSKNLSTLVTELLDERIAVNTPTGRRTVSRIEVLLRKLIEIGGKGNPRAIEQVLRQYASAQAAMAPVVSDVVVAAEDMSAADAASIKLLRELMMAELSSGDMPGGAA